MSEMKIFAVIKEDNLGSVAGNLALNIGPVCRSGKPRKLIVRIDPREMDKGGDSTILPGYIESYLMVVD